MSKAARFRDVEQILKACAPGSSWRVSRHSRVVEANGRTYRSLPKFDDIFLQEIRKMLRHLGISLECARGFIPAL